MIGGFYWICPSFTCTRMCYEFFGRFLIFCCWRRYIRKAMFTMGHKLNGAAFNTWQMFTRGRLRRKRIMHKAATRILYVGLTKAFKPWAAQARQQVRI